MRRSLKEYYPLPKSVRYENVSNETINRSAKPLLDILNRCTSKDVSFTGIK